MTTFASLVTLAAAGNSPWKYSVDVVATSNLTLSAAQTVDTVALTDGDTCLAVGQTNLAQCGPYVVRTGAWERTTDADSSHVQLGSMIYVRRGSVANRKSLWALTYPASGTLVVGSTQLLFQRIAGAYRVLDHPIASTLILGVIAEEIVHVHHEIESYTTIAAKATFGAAITGHATDNAILAVKMRDGAGGAAVAVATLTTNVAGTVTAWVPKDCGAITNPDLVTPSLLTFGMTKGGAGVVTPAGLLQVLVRLA